MASLAPNHHADYPQFTGAFGYLAGVSMITPRARADAELAARLACLGPDDVAVDIGCGPGSAVRLASTRARRVVGVDPSEPMLRLARWVTALRRIEGPVEWVRAGAETTGLDDGVASVCWSIASVHHWPDLDGSLAELRRIVRPGGVFVALERRTVVGAVGNAGHGWTDDQATEFARLLALHGFVDPEVGHHRLGRRRLVAVVGRRGD